MTLHKLVIFSYLVIAGFGFLFPLYADEEKFVGIVLREGVNVRAGNSVDSEVLGQLKKGEGVEVLANEYGWYKISLPRQAACFVSKKFVKDGYIIGEKVNLRAGAGVNFSIIGQAQKGQRVDILAEDGDWLKVAPARCAFGYVRSDMIRHSAVAMNTSREELYESLNVQVNVK